MLEIRPVSAGGASHRSASDCPAVQVRELSLSYRTGEGVHNLSFIAEFGQITALLGPNGAGKTTTVECCVGLRTPDSGAVTVMGANPLRGTASHRASVGVMLQDGGLPMGARAADLLRHIARMYRHPWPPAELSERLGLNAFGHKTVRRLSGGQRQQLALACSLLGRPRVLFVDEPTAGLDPAARQQVWDLLTEVRAAGTAIVLTTHLIDEAERLAEHVVILNHGQVIASGSPSELTTGSQDVGRFQAPAGLELRSLRTALPESVHIREVSSGHYLLEGRINPQVLTTLSSWCTAHEVMPRQLQIGTRSLEDVFLELTGNPLSRNRDG